MIRFYLIGGALVAFLTLGGMFAWQGQQLRARKAEVEKLQSQVKSAAETAQIEYRTQTVIRKIYVASEQARENVKQVDPQCSNDGPLVAAWRTGLDGLHKAADDAHDTSDGAGAVPVAKP